MIISLVIVLAIILAVALTTIYALFSGIGWVPTRQLDIDRFLCLAEVRSGQKVYDLGCGDGRLVICADKLGAQAIGFEISILPYIGALVRKILAGSKAQIKFRDFWWVDLRQADVVYFFLIPRIYSRLKKKLEKELKPGTKVVTLVWPIPGWHPSAVDKVSGRPTLYLYIR